MLPGFIPHSRGTFMLDFVTLVMALVLPVIFWNVRLAQKGRYAAHKRNQLVVASILGLAVTAFEVDMRLNGWEHGAKASPWYPDWVFPLLYIHLFFSVSTLILWIAVIIRAMKKFPSPPRPAPHSPTHRLLGRWAVVGMTGTVVTGWLFYYVAFIAI